MKEYSSIPDLNTFFTWAKNNLPVDAWEPIVSHDITYKLFVSNIERDSSGTNTLIVDVDAVVIPPSDALTKQRTIRFGKHHEKPQVLIYPEMIHPSIMEAFLNSMYGILNSGYPILTVCAGKVIDASIYGPDRQEIRFHWDLAYLPFANQLMDNRPEITIQSIISDATHHDLTIQIENYFMTEKKVTFSSDSTSWARINDGDLMIIPLTIESVIFGDRLIHQNFVTKHNQLFIPILSMNGLSSEIKEFFLELQNKDIPVSINYGVAGSHNPVPKRWRLIDLTPDDGSNKHLTMSPTGFEIKDRRLFPGLQEELTAPKPSESLTH